MKSVDIKLRKSLPLAFMLLVTSLLSSYNSYSVDHFRSNITVFMQYLAVLVIVLSFGVANLGAVFRLNLRSLPYVLFVLYCFCSVGWSISSSQTLIYSVTIACISFSLGVFYSGNSVIVSKTCGMTSICIAAAMCTLPPVLGIRERTFGYITPNLIASYGFLIVVLCCFIENNIRRYAIGSFGFILIVFSEGRTIFIASILFVLLMFVLGRSSTTKGRIYSLFAILTLSLLLVLLWQFFSDDIIYLVSAPLGVANSARLDSSLTGRTNLWYYGMILFSNSPFLGYGFATRQGYDFTSMDPSLNAHSGAINMLLDTGIFGFALFSCAILVSIVHYVREGEVARRHVSNVSISVLCSFLVLLAVEPNYIQATHPISWLIMMVIVGAGFKTPNGNTSKN